jgi:hypothetical protein
MAKVYPEISADMAEWIGAQPMFFVGTAAASVEHTVNVSPKGLDTLRLLGPTSLMYLDLSGSGAETAAHVRENGRIVLMFCAFAGPPRIVRLHGRADIVTRRHADWPACRNHFGDHAGARAVVRVQVGRVSDSCGYGVPVFDAPRQREALPMWAGKKGVDGLRAYRRQKNSFSIDGLPAFGEDDQ